MRSYLTILLFILFSYTTQAQYTFEGTVSGKHVNNTVYLSLVDDYRNYPTINNEFIIGKATIDSLGYFKFEGNQLENQHRIYKLHIDNCDEASKITNHFEGHCVDSKSIIFIAKNNDSISFPLSFDEQVFCDVKSSNPKALAFIKVDELLEDMKYDYTEYDSKVNRDLNNKKWFAKLQYFGQSLNESLAELYIFAFLSDRSKPFHNYFLNDVKENAYYEELLERLHNSYPKSLYTNQYEMELSSIRYQSNYKQKNSSFNYSYLLIGLLLASIGLNIWFFLKSKQQKETSKTIALSQLTKQEQNVLDLMLENNSNKAIAEALFVSLSTVKSHINNIYKKLNISSRDELKQQFNK